MTTKEQIYRLLERIDDKDLVVASLGTISRSLYNIRKEMRSDTNDFYCQGAMGSVLGIGLGLALNTKKKVWVLIGDGSFLMKMGTMATILKCRPKNLRIIIFNNKELESTGGQKTSFDYIKEHIPFEILEVQSDYKKSPRPKGLCWQITDKFREKVLS